MKKQGIIKENILAAGDLDYIFEFGDQLGIFKLVDALVLNWAAGSIDVIEGPAAALLYRYWKLREERASAEERGMVYRRVLNKGNTKVLSRMVVNEPFPHLWHNLMAEVANYIDKIEKVDLRTGEFSPVSRSCIFQATRKLQYNLTEYCTGLAHVQAREFLEQLKECIEILKDEEVIAYFCGNRRKSFCKVIEKLSKEVFRASPYIAAHHTLAVNGNKVFQWIANFNGSSVRQEEFENFLYAAESYILNFTNATGEEIEWDEQTEEDNFELSDSEENDF